MKLSSIIAVVLLFLFAIILGTITFYPGAGGATKEQEFNALVIATIAGTIAMAIGLWQKKKHGVAFS